MQSSQFRLTNFDKLLIQGYGISKYDFQLQRFPKLSTINLNMFDLP
jgi:hypothetical protein